MRIQRGGQEEVEALSYVSVLFYFQLISEVEVDNTLNKHKDLITSTAIICKFM